MENIHLNDRNLYIYAYFAYYKLNLIFISYFIIFMKTGLLGAVGDIKWISCSLGTHSLSANSQKHRILEQEEIWEILLSWVGGAGCMCLSSNPLILAHFSVSCILLPILPDEYWCYFLYEVERNSSALFGKQEELQAIFWFVLFAGPFLSSVFKTMKSRLSF